MSLGFPSKYRRDSFYKTVIFIEVSIIIIITFSLILFMETLRSALWALKDRKAISQLLSESEYNPPGNVRQVPANRFVQLLVRLEQANQVGEPLRVTLLV